MPSPRFVGLRRDERGASLILALGFILAIGLVIGSVASLATEAFTTTRNLSTQRNLEANAESAASIAIQYARTKFQIYTSISAPCITSAFVFNGMTAFCTGSPANIGSPASRTVEVSACPPPVSGNSCGNTYLHAVVTYDDLPPNSPPGADTCTVSNTSGSNTCGIAVTILSWDVRSADN
jgi:hypothetical protein